MKFEAVKRRHLKSGDVVWYYIRAHVRPSSLCGPYRITDPKEPLMIYCGAAKEGYTPAAFKLNHKSVRLLREVHP